MLLLLLYLPPPFHPSRYDSGKQYDWSNPGFQMNSGQFTQLVWKATTKLGCAARFCPAIAGFGPGVLVSCRCECSRVRVCMYAYGLQIVQKLDSTLLLCLAHVSELHVYA